MAEINRKVKVAEYGSWSSPITAEIAASNGGFPWPNISDVHTSLNAQNEVTVFWSDLRATEGGRTVVCSWNKDQPDVVTWTPKGFNARTKVHEYGGGSTFVHKGHVYFSNFDDQRMYKQTSPTSIPQPITPDGKGLRYADGQMCEAVMKIICVREDHGVIETGKAKEAKNTIVSIDPETQEQFTLAQGADFYASPKVSPGIGVLAWVQWNHPNMPWDTVALWTGQLSTDGKYLTEGSSRQISCNAGVSIMSPRWTLEHALYFISDRSGWWNLYKYNFDTRDEHNVFPIKKEIGMPQKLFGRCSYATHPKNPKKLAVVCGGAIGILDAEIEKMETINTGFVSHQYPTFSPSGDKIYCIGGSTTRPICLIEVDIESKKLEIIMDTKTCDIDPGYISEPKEITFPTEDNKVAHAYLYLPKNKDFSAPQGSLPPLLVQSHGGPVGAASPTFDLKKQFFTSRGVAILDVNYRGSTGYGTPYRREVYGNWGKVDVEDCCNGALHVANSMKAADREKLCIDGGSAGGFTTLACLTQRNEVFKAGASMYGVSDVQALVRETHKFESRYIDSLIGPLPECIELWKERSPIYHVDKLICPMIFFQGDEDKVVPPNQSELMFNAIKEKGIACCYVLFEGEQHGFRKSETIISVLQGEFCFFANVFGYKPADFDCKLNIENIESVQK
ncbi:uncharacterized protein LOC114522328 [Dendronephthya gigantea]|uniref:uncharacterized protein LOC114522328 n=1 Tax=Dendronephthya gigantea TaxID=151771 RepID=UPI00106C1705|nr:uncharacterized protein LOC114522328 [Dendronephthya gigantea]